MLVPLMCPPVTSDVLTGTSDDIRGFSGYPWGLRYEAEIRSRGTSYLVPLLVGSECTWAFETDRSNWGWVPALCLSVRVILIKQVPKSVSSVKWKMMLLHYSMLSSVGLYCPQGDKNYFCVGRNKELLRKE